MKETIYKIYAMTSLLLLFVLSVSPFRNRATDWRAIQNYYNKVAAALPDTPPQIPIKIRQIWVRDLNRIDRCPTCHLPMKTVHTADIPRLFRPHPKMYHDTDKLGCTICHEGQGLATNYADAHLPNKSWERPKLPLHYVESSCGRCHLDANLKEMPHLNQGKLHVNDFKCSACHNLPQVSDTFSPSHNGIGSKVTGRNWLVRWLKNPKGFHPKTRMPDFFLSDKEIQLLADFLMSFTTFRDSLQLAPLPDVYLRNKNDENFIDRGKTLFREGHCISCHAVGEQGGKLAVDLSKIASKANEKWIFNYIGNPQDFQPGVEMPQFGFSNEEVAAVTAYIVSEFIDWNIHDEIDAGYKPEPDFFAKGKAIYYQYNCSGCHQLSGMEIAQNRGPELVEISDKRIYQIYFENVTIPHTIFDYVTTKLKTPRIFGETMRMPQFNFNEEDRQVIATYLLSLHKMNIPDRLVQRESKLPVYRPPGEAGILIKKFHCFKCHRINGTGGTVAPDLSIVGSRLQRDWLTQFLKTPYSIRPLIEERMLKLSMKDHEINTIENYFFTALVDDSLSAKTEWHQSAASVAGGKKLFREKYGCNACHEIKGNGGFLGPILDGVGKRLQPNWMLHWILNPQKYIPDTIEPRTGMSEKEAREIVVYLMSLK